MPTTYVTNHHQVFPVKNTSYRLTWNGVTAGAYTLTAVATDDGGATTISEPVDITVVTNLPPRVRIESPSDYATYYAPGTIGICAAVTDAGAAVTSVEFFSGTNSLGVVTNSISVTNHASIYEQFCLTWSGVASGTYTVTAVATDAYGATGVSAPIKIFVVTPPPPTVRISTDGGIFFAPANIWISASTRNFPDPVASVQYFAGTKSLGIATNRPSFWFQWTNVLAGSYSLTAAATDVSGTNTVTSYPISVQVKTNQPPRWR